MKRKFLHLLNVSILFIILSISLAQPVFAYSNLQDRNQAIVMTASGPLTPAMLQYLTRGLNLCPITRCRTGHIPVEHSRWRN